VSALEVARDHARSRSRLAETLRLEARESWAQVDPARISETWAPQIPRLLLLLTGGQHAAAVSADRYVTEVLVEQGINPATEGRLNAAALSRIASDGRPLESLLAQPGIVAKVGATRAGRDESIPGRWPRAMSGAGFIADRPHPGRRRGPGG
jgi:hypothetical protein